MKAMLTKILSLLLVVTVTAGVAITGTLAYLTDRDSEANVFTVGDVSIDLEEDFDQGATLIPGVDIEKKPTITNTGKNDAWVWAEIAIPAAFDNDDASKNVIHFNYSKESVAAGLWNWKGNGNWMVSKDVEIEGIKYNVYTVLYDTILKPGETTKEPVMTKVYMDPHVDIAPDGKVYHVENGVAEDLNWDVDDYGNPVIYVSAYAMQAEGFNTALDAYTAYNAQWTTDAGENKGLEWGGEAPVVNAANKTEMKTALTDALQEQADAGVENPTVIVDAEGANMGDLNYGLNTTTVPEGATVVIKNAVFDGKSYGNAVDGTVIFENCTFTNTGAYSIHFDAGNGNVVFKNCTLEGWCSFGSAIKSVKMENCNLKGNGTYAMYRFYQDTTMTNCTIDCSNANTEDVYVDGVSAVNYNTLTMNNCTIVYADYEVADNGKIIADGTTVLESVDNSYELKNAG